MLFHFFVGGECAVVAAAGGAVGLGFGVLARRWLVAIGRVLSRVLAAALVFCTFLRIFSPSLGLA